MKWNLAVVLLCLVAFVSCRSVTLGRLKPLHNINQNEFRVGDKQNTTYEAIFHPVEVERKVSLTPFFSPDNSLQLTVDLIQRAKRKIDISIPSFSSWDGCTFGTVCVGCYASFLHANESFPVFPALVNAIHRGVAVRILTNNFDDKICSYKMTPIIYLQLAGAKVHQYVTTSFNHVKYVAIDDEEAAVSSVNYSKASFTKNREAGIVIANETSGALVGFLRDVFEYDFNKGDQFPITQQYSELDYKIVNNPNPIPVNVPAPLSFSCETKSPAPTPINAYARVRIVTSPDYAYETIVNSVKRASSSLSLSIYQVTDDSMCDLLIELNKKLTLKLFVSNVIYGDDDAKAAEVCYRKLYENGVTVRKSAAKCLTYSHQKFWIIDGGILWMSTGNWSPSDYPQPPYVFPPAGQAGYRRANRDFTIEVSQNQEIIDRFQRVFEEDYSQGHDYVPSSN